MFSTPGSRVGRKRSSGGSTPFANPSATAKDTAVNGVAGTAMRSDSAPPVQKGSSSQFGIVKVDGSTITDDGTGKISASGIVGGASIASYNWNWVWSGSTFTHSFACSANLVQPQRKVTVYSAAVGLTTVSGGVYKIGIAPYDTVANKITAAPVYTSAFTEGTGTSNAWVVGNFGSGGVALTGGSNYIIFVVRTDGGTTPSTTLQTVAALADGTIPGFITSGLSSTNKSFHLASTGPTTSDVWTTENGWYLFVFSFGF